MRDLDPEQEEQLAQHLGNQAYGLLMRLRLRDQSAPAKANDFITAHDRQTATVNTLQHLEREELLSRPARMDATEGRSVRYITHVENDPLQHNE